MVGFNLFHKKRAANETTGLMMIMFSKHISTFPEEFIGLVSAEIFLFSG
jgi:hypothetical protein